MAPEDRTARLRPETGLTSAAWVIGGQTGVRLLGLLNTAIAARLLGPDAFGTLALAGMLIALLSTMSSFGFDWALVQRRPESREVFDAAWTSRVILGCCVAGLSILAANVSERFFNIPGLALMTSTLAVLPVLTAMESMGLIQLRIQSIFRVEVTIALISKTLTIVVTAGLAYLLRNAWALVAGMLFSRFITTLASFLVHPYRPRLTTNGIGQLASFSGWYYLGSIMDFVRARVPAILLGKYHNPFQTGLYQTSGEISYAPLSELIAPLNRIAYVRYTTLQFDRQGLRAMFLSTTGATWLVVWPICALTMLTADEVVRLVLGPLWIAAVPVIHILAVAALFSSVGSTSVYLVLAVGQARENTIRTSVSAAAISALALMWIPRHGAIGAAYAVAVGQGLSGFWGLAVAARAIRVHVRSLTGLIVRPALATLVPSLGVAWLSEVLPQAGDVSGALCRFMVLSVVFGCGYLACVYSLWRASGKPRGPETYLAEKLSQARRAVRLRTGTT